MAKRKAMAEELLARAEPNGCKTGAYREEDNSRDNEKHTDKTMRNQNAALDRYVSWGIKMALSEMQEDVFQRILPAPNEACQALLSSQRSVGSRSSNSQGFFSLLHHYELRQDCGHTHG